MPLYFLTSDLIWVELRLNPRCHTNSIQVFDLSQLRMQLFNQHQVFDRVVLPGASHLLLAAAAHLEQLGGRAATALELTDAIFEWLVTVDGQGLLCWA